VAQLKSGVARTFDATKGEFLWANSTTDQNIISSIDNTGLVTVNEEMVVSDPTKTIAMCPTDLGGRDWPTAAYSPKTNPFFVPLNNMCADITAKDQEATPANVYNVDSVYKIAPGHENVGRIDAVSVETGETLWSWETKGALYAPILATDGDLLFTGGYDPNFRAINANTGEDVWSTRLPSSVHGHATTFKVDGKRTSRWKRAACLSPARCVG